MPNSIKRFYSRTTAGMLRQVIAFCYQMHFSKLFVKSLLIKANTLVHHNAFLSFLLMFVYGLLFSERLFLYQSGKISFKHYVASTPSVWLCLFQDPISLCRGQFKFRINFIIFQCDAFNADVPMFLIIYTA